MKTKSDIYNYGKCEICDTALEEKRVNQNFWIHGQLIIVEDVPAGVCPQCGEKIVRADVGHWITGLIENPERIENAPRISIPSIKFNEAEIST